MEKSQRYALAVYCINDQEYPDLSYADILQKINSKEIKPGLDVYNHIDPEILIESIEETEGMAKQLLANPKEFALTPAQVMALTIYGIDCDELSYSFTEILHGIRAGEIGTLFEHYQTIPYKWLAWLVDNADITTEKLLDGHL